MKKFITILFCALSINALAQTFQTIFEDNTYQLTGVAVSESGRLFTNYPRWSNVYRYALVEVKNNNEVIPFPNAEWNTWDISKGGDKAKHFLCVQAVVIDDKDNMWVVDAGYAKNADGNDKGQKLVKINLRNNEVEKVYLLYPELSLKSYANDIRIDTRRQVAYLTNSGEGGIVIVDLKSGHVRQVLLGTNVTKADTNYSMKRLGQPLLSNSKSFNVHSDGIALTPDGSMLYFKSLTDDKLFRIATTHLHNTSLTPQALLAKVEFVGNFTTTDGMAFDDKGNLYLGDLEKRKLVRITTKLKTQIVIPENEELAWPDSYHLAKNGWLYISLSRIDEEARFHNGQSARKGAYKIIKVQIH